MMEARGSEVVDEGVEARVSEAGLFVGLGLAVDGERTWGWFLDDDSLLSDR